MPLAHNVRNEETMLMPLLGVDMPFSFYWCIFYLQVVVAVWIFYYSGKRARHHAKWSLSQLHTALTIEWTMLATVLPCTVPPR